MSETSSETKLPNLADESPSLDELSLTRLRQIARDLRLLANSPGWLYLSQVLLSQAAMRFQQLGRWQPSNVSEMVEQAGLRGEANGFELLANWPEFLLAAIEKQLESLGTLEEEEEDELDG